MPSMAARTAVRLRLHAVPALAICLVVAGLLAQVPLANQIMGGCDSLLAITLSNHYVQRLEAFVAGHEATRPLYPADPVGYGESSIGGAVIFLSARLLGASDATALLWYQFVLVSALGLAVYAAALTYGTSRAAAFFAAFAVLVSNFLWANVDDLQVIWFAIPVAAFTLFRTALQTQSRGTLAAAAIVGGLQMYFSVQVYVYQTALLGLAVLGDLKRLRCMASPHRLALLVLIPYLAIPLPLFLFYLHTVVDLGVVNAWDYPEVYRFEGRHFLAALPGTLIRYPFVTYLSSDRWSDTIWIDVRRLGFLGVTLPILGLAALRLHVPGRGVLAAIIGCGVVLAFGSVITIGSWSVTSPLDLLYRHVPLFRFLRIAVRSHMLTIIGLSLLGAQAVDRLARRVPAGPWQTVVPLLLGALVAAETLPWGLNPYERIPFPEPDPAYVDCLRATPGAVVLDLPSHSTGFYQGYVNEVIYTLWQTRHRRNAAGGVNGYYPPSRIAIQAITDRLPADEAFDELLGAGVTHLAVHSSPDLYIPPSWRLPWASTTNRLRRLASGRHSTVYEIRPRPSRGMRLPSSFFPATRTEAP